MYWHTKVSEDITDSRCTCSYVLRKLKIRTDVLTHTNVHLLRKMKITDIKAYYFTQGIVDKDGFKALTYYGIRDYDRLKIH